MPKKKKGFFRRNMSYPKGRSWRSGRKLTEILHARDGEDNVTTIDPGGTTNFLLLLGTQDIYTAAGEDFQTHKNVGRLTHVRMRGDFHLDDGETQAGSVTFLHWLIAMAPLQVSDWQTNGRDSNDGALASTVNANPYKLLAVKHTTLSSLEAGSRSAPARFSYNLPYKVNMPFGTQLYWMYKGIVTDDDAGAWAAGEIGFTYTFDIGF